MAKHKTSKLEQKRCPIDQTNLLKAAQTFPLLWDVNKQKFNCTVFREFQLRQRKRVLIAFRCMQREFASYEGVICNSKPSN